MKKMKVGFIGAGVISGKLARTIAQMEEVENYAIASRSIEKAQAFADEMGFCRAYGSYEELLEDPEVDLVYIGTPHSLHYEQTKLSLHYGKPVLCEKPFTVNAKQAEELITLAREKNLFLMEAMWSRCLPFVENLKSLLADGIIGTPQLLIAKACSNASAITRMQEPELAGGALLDVGIYPLTLADLIFGPDFTSYTTAATKTEKGVDAHNSTTLVYPDGKMAIIYSSFHSHDTLSAVITGTQGCLVLDNIYHCQKITHYAPDESIVKEYDFPFEISGYEYELREAKQALETGALESQSIPHEKTLQMLRFMDQLRTDWDVIYPFE